MKIPPPAITDLARSQQLIEHIGSVIEQQQGVLPFSQYMELALYTPTLGYYAGALPKIGEQGDFVTAPEISSLFSQCLAKQSANVLAELKSGDILEFGAGRGTMACDILLALEQLQQLPQHYYIIEISENLQQRQQHLLQEKIPHLFERIRWLKTMPQDFNGVILANEVLDAMPVEIFHVDTKTIQQLFIDPSLKMYFDSCINQQIINFCTDLSTKLPAEVLERGYQSEINLQLEPWLKHISEHLQRGTIFLIDYGFSATEYYHPDRHMGTLMCHYQHLTHPDPLLYPGLQDITAHVDFSAVINIAESLGLTIQNYCTQANFLLSSGILELAQQQATDAITQLRHSKEIQKLVMPHEMGELFKVLVLSRLHNN